jgi:hypothetical protein
MPTALRVKDFDRFQHYKDRSPPWIKLYNAVLDDYAFSRLQDASKWHLIAIWLLASRSDNSIPDDAAWIGRMIGATQPVALDPLLSCGFIERYDIASGALAERERVAIPEGKKRESRVRVKVESESGGFGQVWQEYPKRAGGNPRPAAVRAYAARVKAGASEEALLAGTRRYAAYVRATGKEGTEYVKQAATFFGPDGHWAEPWTIPVTPTSGPAPFRTEAFCPDCGQGLGKRHPDDTRLTQLHADDCPRAA